MMSKQPKRKTQKQMRLTKIERHEREMQRLAGLLASTGDSVTAPPELLNDPRRAIALRFWTDHAPRLAALGVLDDLSRLNLWLLAAYVSEWITADDDVQRRGYSMMVPTVAGGARGAMPRLNPAVDRRDHALKVIIELQRHFGFSALDRAALMRLRRAVDSLPMFPSGDEAPRASSATAADPGQWDRLERPKVN